MQIDPAVLAVLSRATLKANTLTITERLDRPMYLAANTVLEAAGGKWNRKEKAHVFDGDASERVEQMLATGSIEVPKDEFNYFPSPPDVVAQLMDLAGVSAGMHVLEPSAGRGAIALACAEAGAVVDVCELMDANYRALLDLPRLRAVVNADFLMVEAAPYYDRVVMNPPFMKQADIRHVLHALQFLKPDGLLVAVMGAGVTFRENALARDFRQLVEDRGGIIDPLPDGAFKESGTMVRTVIVTIPGEDA